MKMIRQAVLAISLIVGFTSQAQASTFLYKYASPMYEELNFSFVFDDEVIPRAIFSDSSFLIDIGYINGVAATLYQNAGGQQHTVIQDMQGNPYFDGSLTFPLLSRTGNTVSPYYNGSGELVRVHNAFNSSAGSYGDKFTVTEISAVPEPAAWIAMILGFGLIGYAMRRGRIDAGAVDASQA